MNGTKISFNIKIWQFKNFRSVLDEEFVGAADAEYLDYSYTESGKNILTGGTVLPPPPQTTKAGLANLNINLVWGMIRKDIQRI